MPALSGLNEITGHEQSLPTGQAGVAIAAQPKLKSWLHNTFNAVAFRYLRSFLKQA